MSAPGWAFLEVTEGSGTTGIRAHSASVLPCAEDPEVGRKETGSLEKRHAFQHSHTWEQCPGVGPGATVRNTSLQMQLLMGPRDHSWSWAQGLVLNA